MFKIEGNNMYITKLDALDLTVNITDSTGTPIEFKNDDVVTLTVKTKYGGTTLFSKNATFSGVDAVIHADSFVGESGAIIDVGRYSASIIYKHRHNGANYDTYTIFPTWSSKGDTRLMRGDIDNWDNFWVVPNL